MRRLYPLVLMLLIGACAFNQFGPWRDESGQPLEGSQVLQYQGFEECGHEDVVFISFFGRMYAQDEGGVLGQLTGEDGEILTFAILDAIPDGVVARGLTLGDREIYFEDATLDEYLYIHRNDEGRTERWPRAEIDCDRRGGFEADQSGPSGTGEGPGYNYAEHGRP
jgi:hypothetical protein